MNPQLASTAKANGFVKVYTAKPNLRALLLASAVTLALGTTGLISAQRLQDQIVEAWTHPYGRALDTTPTPPPIAANRITSSFYEPGVTIYYSAPDALGQPTGHRVTYSTAPSGSPQPGATLSIRPHAQ